jgi:hypothetical protein
MDIRSWSEFDSLRVVDQLIAPCRLGQQLISITRAAGRWHYSTMEPHPKYMIKRGQRHVAASKANLAILRRCIYYLNRVACKADDD